MRVSRIAALVLLSLLTWSCGDGHGGDHLQAHEAGEHEPAKEVQGLRLNEGKKWEMDEHTRSMFAAMAKRVGEWNSEVETAENLGKALRNDLDALIQGCTMTGDAHAELHKFLVALIPAVEELEASGADGQVVAVEELLVSYPQYFE